MSYQAMTWATKCRVGDPILKLLLLTLANFANEDGETWHSQKRIAFDSEIPERTLRRKMAALAEMGLIEITQRTREDGTRTTSLIRMLAVQPAATVADGNQRPKQGVTIGQNGGLPAATMVAGQDSKRNRKESTIDRATRGREAEQFFDDQFWPEYPRRLGSNPKEPARKKIVAVVISGENPQIILDGVRRLAAEQRKLNHIGTQFVPQAVTWINGRGWKDDPMPDAGPPRSASGGQMGFFAAAAAIDRGR